MVVTDENLHQVLMALKDAGVTHCRLGDAEFHFASELPEREAIEPPRQVVIPVMPHSSPAPEMSPGYASLFRDGAPSFKQGQ